MISKRRSKLLISGFLILLILLVGLNTATGDENLENEVRRISHMLRCPTCQAMSVKESEAGISVNMKNKVRVLLQEGKSEAEILDYFLKRYGEWILRSPQKTGFNLLLWLMPAVLIVIATFLVYRYLGRQAQESPVDHNVTPLSDAEQALIKKDLESRLREP